MISVFDDDRIDIRNIKTGFNDGGADQYLYIVLIELIHDIFNLILRHSGMDDCDFRSLEFFLKSLCDSIDCRDFIVEIINLSMSIELFSDNLIDQFVVLLCNIGFDRHTIDRSLREKRHASDT